MPHSIDTQNRLKQAAISLSTLGWRVFPLAPFSKRPRFKDWSWQEYASNDPQTVASWWTRWPDSNIAVLADDRFTGIDLDAKPGKVRGWDVVGHLMNYATVWTITPNGGYHFYYNPVGQRLQQTKGVDIKQGHSYFVAPPSIIQPDAPWEDPTEYKWGRAPGAPWDIGLQDADSELVEMLKDVPRETSSTDQPLLLENPPQIPYADLEPHHIVFLTQGHHAPFNSRSEMLQSIGTRFYRLGYTDAEVLTMMWTNQWVMSTCLDHRQQDYDSALIYLWFGLNKVRHYRRPKPSEVFQPVAGSRKEENFQRLQNEALRMLPGNDCRDLLKRVACANLDAFEEDSILSVLKQHGFQKQMLGNMLKTYKKSARKIGNPKKIKWEHVTGEEERPLPTVENLAALLEHKNATVHHNLMDHRILIQAPGYKFDGENGLNNQLTAVRSWAAEHRMPMDAVPEQLVMLASANPYHPFQQFVNQRRWDGRSRLQSVMDTVRVPEDKVKARDTFLRRWLISVVAAVEGYDTRAPRGVLTFTGPQQIGKTTWLKYLVPDGMAYLGHLLRPEQRDSATKPLRYLITEIGELDATFKSSSIEQLKAYIGQHEDVYRLPYARDESRWKRRTVFAASANSNEILHDMTGNTRWWVVPVESFNLDAMEQMWGGGWGYELQQFWAEVKALYDAGERWDLADEELKAFGSHWEEHREWSSVETALRETYAWDLEGPPPNGYGNPRRIKDIQKDIGWNRPFNNQEQRIIKDTLRMLTGQREALMKRIKLVTGDGQEVAETGRYWYCPAKNGGSSNVVPFKPVQKINQPEWLQ